MSTSVKYVTVYLDKNFNRSDIEISYIKPRIKFLPAIIAEQKVQLCCIPTDTGFSFHCAAPLDLCMGKILLFVTKQSKNLLSYCTTDKDQQHA